MPPIILLHIDPLAGASLHKHAELHQSIKLIMLRCVRTTITLEDDVAASLKRLGKGRGLKFKDLVNLALREGMKNLTTPAKKRKIFQTRSADLGSCRIANVDNIAEVLAVAEGESFR